MIFLTTTAIDLDEELLNRCLVLTVNEDCAQTQAIHRQQREKQTLEGLLARRERDEILKIDRNAQRLLKPLFVVNPYARELTFLDAQTRTRRDHGKYEGPEPVPGPPLPYPISAPKIPCTSNIPNVAQTLDDLAANLNEIAASAQIDTSAFQSLVSMDVAGEIATISASSGSSQVVPFYQGGHFDLDLSLNSLAGVFNTSQLTAFNSTFGGVIGGTRQPAVFGNPAQGNYTLHSKRKGRGTSIKYDFHFDTYNPLRDVVGLAGHLFGDVIGGHNGTPCLDPAWSH